MDDDELTVSSQDSMDDIRRMVAEAQRKSNGSQPLPPPLTIGADDDELTVEATDWVMAQINAGMAGANRVHDGESTLDTEPRFADTSAVIGFEPPAAAPLPIRPSSLSAFDPPQRSGAADGPREDVFAVLGDLEVQPPTTEHTLHRNNFDALPAGGQKWQPPERMVRPTEPDVPHPHHLAKRWKLISIVLAAALAVVVAFQVVGMLTGDESPGEAPTETVIVSDTSPDASVSGG